MTREWRTLLFPPNFEVRSTFFWPVYLPSTLAIMQMTSLWPALLSPNQPCLLHFQREPQSAVTHGRASRATRPQIEIPSPFLACNDNDRTRTFVDIETGESWAQIIKISSSLSEDPTDVLSAPSLGITQLPVSRFLDDMDGLYGERLVAPIAARAQLALNDNMNT
jgi:hypothetical protein